MASGQPRTPVPDSMKIQFARLFGQNSQPAKKSEMTPAEWKRTLNRVLQDLEKYLLANVYTDDFHFLLLLSGIQSSAEALKEDDFWPRYAEGITRLALMLMGDYPDHRRRRPGRKANYHYKLNTLRDHFWTHSPEQQFLTLCHAYQTGFLKLQNNPRKVLSDFRARFGYSYGYRDFMKWYRDNYADDYGKVF